MKPFKTIEQQIELLKGRGLLIDDEEDAMRYLLSSNYYNIINGYSKYFPRKGDNYIAGTSFDEISRLYLFDKNIKQAYFEAIICSETHLKSIFAYRFAEAYPNKPYAYLNTDCYNPEKVLSAVSTINSLSSIISQQKQKKNGSVKHYIDKHGDVPIWVLINYLDFGGLRYMLDLIPATIQNKISKDLLQFAKQNIASVGVFPPEIMISFVKNIHEVRNVCAHNNRLIGFRCKSDDKYWADLHTGYYSSEKSVRRDSYSVLVSLRCFLSKAEYGTLYNKVIKCMKRLDNHLHSISSNGILEALGFPKDWHKNTRKIEY